MSKLLLLRNQSGLFNYLDSISGAIYWEFQETSGTTARAKVSGAYNSAYDATNTGATVGQPGAGSIPYSYSFNGSNNVVDLYSAALASAFNPQVGTLIIFAKVDAWDANVKTIYQFAADAANRVYINRTNDALQMTYRANNVPSTTSYAGQTTTDFFMAAITWDNGAIKTYRNLQNLSGSYSDTWVGPLSSNNTTVGAYQVSSPSFVHNGDAMVAIYHPTRAMTPTEIATIYNRSGI